MDLIDIAKLLEVSLREFSPEDRENFLRLVYSLYYLGLSSKIWIFRKPLAWKKQYWFAEDVAKIIHLVNNIEGRKEQAINLTSTSIRTPNMEKLLKELGLLNQKIDESLKDLLIEKIISPNISVLFSVVIADMMLSQKRKYTIQFWATFLISTLSAVATILIAYIGIR